MNPTLTEETPLATLTVGQMKLLLSNNYSATLHAQSLPETVGIDEVAKITGYTKATIYKFIHLRQIPFHKPAHGGRRVFFRRDEIDDWLHATRVETNQEFFNEWDKKPHRKPQMPNSIMFTKISREYFVLQERHLSLIKLQLLIEECAYLDYEEEVLKAELARRNAE